MAILYQGLLDGGGYKSKTHTSSSGSTHGGGGSHSFGQVSSSGGRETSSTYGKPTVEISTTSNKIIYPDTGIIPWMRYLYLEFTNSNGKKFTLGGYDDSLAISVSGTKTLADVGDTASISIYNLPMMDVMKLSHEGFTANVKIYCGYYNTSKIKIFDGGVTYLEEGKTGRNTSVLKLECANGLISDRFQEMVSLSLASGYNMYRAIQEVEAAYGISGQIEIDECLKEDELIGDLSKYDTLKGWTKAIINSSAKNRNYAIGTSGKSGLASIMGYRKMGSGDTYVINTRDVNLQAFPTISSSGLKIVLSPIYDMKPGDIISIDNTIQATVSALNGSSNNGYIGNMQYLDKDGLYNIRQMEYDLSNRSDEFNVEILAISKMNLQAQMLGENK